eukprot:CAMPEP_0202008582 /NCGR_PEP_ID=MMETSP0905-20130828/14087_1 /ASSEMBLY_ACC=CAM_ASM_000554 /TAXON_ID=420261 /ORGANISM="Thalassiosira antarctica, Strain CCMP982" /LENGTH=136 /DNA_ID=CAMNT_0048566801 /DNA_START=34 /DNA_END=442 /DNA_ORIENTATION=-
MAVKKIKRQKAYLSSSTFDGVHYQITPSPRASKALVQDIMSRKDTEKEVAIANVSSSKDKEWSSKIKKMEKTIKKTAKSKHNVKTKAIVKNHKAIVKDHEDQVLQMKKLHSKELEKQWRVAENYRKEAEKCIHKNN